ncbi:TetR family transcriptional regulator [Cryptosporangium aurantiacum]|uniref:Transcriptional regulator, TetR family n=1 Tax=Cryptosporangium aurantiacum TaxID=134849 RepID=A0A1M7R3Z3_9ACTN|nr:TetR family transcriptional regulator [Cryptosporangium aurantiacum]SHN39707.1 transcriptional regulator, TetR family [Cryptosporangium aurantiacum]
MPQHRPLPVRERARRAVRAELVTLAQDLFAAQGYERTTIEDLVAAAGMSKRTFFRYFTSKEELVLGKHDVWAERLLEAFAARPADEPLWDSLRRTFDVVVDYFDDEAELSRTLAMEKVIHSNPALVAGELERISRVQNQLAEQIGARLDQRSADDPRPAAIAGAALSCLIAAKNAWTGGGHTQPFGELLDQAMAALRPT